MASGEFAWEEHVDSIVILAPSARITMERAQGRWTHHLDLELDSETAREARLRISAVETDPRHDDPTRIVSPAYQEVQRHELAGNQARGICALLTGHLFQHHFSAAVSLFRDPINSNEYVLDFDIADRCRAPVSTLAATYQMRPGSSCLAEADGQSLSWWFTDRHAAGPRLELHCEPPSRLAVTEDRSGSSQVQVLAGLEPTLFTHRVRYQWRWSST